MSKLNARLEERVNLKEEERKEEEQKKQDEKLKRKAKDKSKIWMYYLTLNGFDEKEYLENSLIN